jgi:hypothetical protein
MHLPSRSGQLRDGFLFYILQEIKIMKTISCIILAAVLFSCGNKSAISKKLSGSDSLVITFNVADSDSVLNMVSTTEKKAIRKLSGFLNGKSTGQDQCGYDGNMKFYKNGVEVLPVIFKYSNDSCRHFLYELDAQVMNTSISKEASEFLKSLSTGKNWY